jgi:hypothetical protein
MKRIQVIVRFSLVSFTVSPALGLAGYALLSSFPQQCMFQVGHEASAPSMATSTTSTLRWACGK